jgi:hypothetical protein
MRCERIWLSSALWQRKDARGSSSCSFWRGDRSKARALCSRDPSQVFRSTVSTVSHQRLHLAVHETHGRNLILPSDSLCLMLPRAQALDRCHPWPLRSPDTWLHPNVSLRGQILFPCTAGWRAQDFCSAKHCLSFAKAYYHPSMHGRDPREGHMAIDVRRHELISLLGGRAASWPLMRCRRSGS